MSDAPSKNRLRDGKRRADRDASADACSEPVDRRVARLAGEQHGVVARRQLESLGLARGWIEGRLRRGQLHPVNHGVYAVGHRLIAKEGRWMAAVLACGDGAVLSHRAAGRLLGIVSPGGGLPEVTRPKGWRSQPGIVQHRSPLCPDEVEVVAGIPVTGLSRTLLDLASILSRERLEAALNEAEVLGLTDRISVHALLGRYPRRRGRAMLRAILDDTRRARGVTRRELERRFARVLESTDLPRPHRNADVAVAGRFFEVDCLWREQRVIVELDGRFVHETWRASERDRERDRLLIADGWRPVRVTWRQLRDDAPAVVADLRKLLRQQARAPTL
jgi:very-short-patch-repair endonuclease